MATPLASLDTAEHGARQPAARASGGAAQGSSVELIVTGLEAALRLRAPELQGTTPVVRKLVVRMCRALELDERQQRLADLCARVRDVGIIGLPDDVVRSPSALSPQQWQWINQHPVIGAELLATLPGLEPTAPVVRSHHERWDGEGYPDGLSGDAIPLLSRVIATADAFVSLVTDRPHRRAIEADVALEHLGEQRGSHFDPRTVDALLMALRPGPRRQAAAKVKAEGAGAAGGSGGAGVGGGPAGVRGGTAGLNEALRASEQLSVFVPAHERAMAAAAGGGDLVSAVESSLGLTVAVLAAAQPPRGSRPVANVPDALGVLAPGEAMATIDSITRIPFPWVTPEAGLMFHLRVHGQGVARAAQRIADEAGFKHRDDLITAALLHDVGKLVLARIHPSGAYDVDNLNTSPEQRVERERRETRLDHAMLGGLLIERWGLPSALSNSISRHHRADQGNEMATLLRLADMVALHAHGRTVDRRIMLRLAAECGLSAQSIREVLFDLPHSGSQRRRAQPSPLSKRETDALRLLAAGKLYKDIAADLGVGTSTIRSHLHSTYRKLKVEDRAQAVLRATEMGWI